MVVEKLLLAAFLHHHHRQPVLNEDGRHVSHEWVPTIADQVLQRWSRDGFTERNAQPAVEWLRNACCHARRIETSWTDSPEDDWKGIDVKVHRRGWSLYLGQYGGFGATVLEAWLKKEEKPRLRAPLSDADATRHLASELNYRLRSGWNEERY